MGKDFKPFYEKGVINSFKNENYEIDGQNISYLIREGNNVERTYVIIHGATARKNFMKVFAAELAKQDENARIIVVDLPLHGESTGDRNVLKDINVYFYVDIMEKFLKEKRADGTILGKLNLSGWSMGGSISMLLDLKGVEIDELTLLNSSPFWKFVDLIPPSTKESAKYTVTSEFHKNLTEEQTKELIDSIDNLVTDDEDVIRLDLQGLAPAIYDIRDEIKNINAKTLIVGSTEDVLATIKMFELMESEIPNSKLIMYEDSHSQLIKPVQSEKIVSEIKRYFYM